MSIIVDYKVVNSNFINDCTIEEYWDGILVKRYKTSRRYYGGDVKQFIEDSDAKMVWFNFQHELF